MIELAKFSIALLSCLLLGHVMEWPAQVGLVVFAVSVMLPVVATVRLVPEVRAVLGSGVVERYQELPRRISASDAKCLLPWVFWIYDGIYCIIFPFDACDRVVDRVRKAEQRGYR